MQSSESVITEMPAAEVELQTPTPLPTAATVPDVPSNETEKPPEYESTARVSPPPEIAMFDERPALIAVMGPTGAGKTSFINAVSGSNLQVGHGLRSCTSQIGLSIPFEINNRRVILADTPGFDDTSRPDADILTDIAIFFAEMYRKGQQILGLVYLSPIDSAKMGGTAVRNVEMFRQVVGNAAARNVVILTTKWELAKPELGESREAEMKKDPLFFEPLLNLGASMIRYPTHDDHSIALDIVKGMIESNQPVKLQIKLEMVEEGLAVCDTAAGQILNRAITESIRESEEKHQKQMKELEAQQTRQLGDYLLEIQEEAESNYQQQVAEFERRKQAMRVDIHNAPQNERFGVIFGIVDEFRGAVSNGFRSLAGVVGGGAGTHGNVERGM